LKIKEVEIPVQDAKKVEKKPVSTDLLGARNYGRLS